MTGEDSKKKKDYPSHYSPGITAKQRDRLIEALLLGVELSARDEERRKAEKRKEAQRKKTSLSEDKWKELVKKK
ncbi:MAG: hypothetical protein ACFFFK_06840 [Candidatus Thorarchaeota archaeon]